MFTAAIALFLTVGLLATDGGPLRRFPYSQTAVAAPRSPRCRQGQQILQATPGTIQTPQKVTPPTSNPSWRPSPVRTTQPNLYSLNSLLLCAPKPLSDPLFCCYSLKVQSTRCIKDETVLICVVFHSVHLRFISSWFCSFFQSI